MTKNKVSWKLYSSRRKITLESLIQSGRVSDYSTYSDYCVNLQVEPMIRPDFETQLAGILSSKSGTPSAALTPEPSPQPPSVAHDSSAGVEATVWLAGVQQEPETPKTDDDRRSIKKKKVTDSRQGES